MKETEEALMFGVSLAMAADEALVDGFQWTDVFSIVPALTKLPSAIDGIEKVPSELEGMTEEDRQALIDKVEELELASELSEEIAEQGLRVGVEIGRLIMLIRQARKKEE